MDFHRLTRRELQTLCKRNKIPANITNVAMADALKALEIVEGIEEFLNPSQSATAQSSIESPEKSEVTSPAVPRTGARTTRRKTVKDDVQNSQTLTRTRRSTRKFAVGEVDEKSIKMAENPSATNSKRPQGASVRRRKIDAQLKEVEEDKVENKDISETPDMVTGSRRRGLLDESTVRYTYGTRRSSRLAEKNKRKTNENDEFERVKSGLFPEESGENLEVLEMNVKESPDDLCEIIQTTDVDLKRQSEEDLERDNDKEINSDKADDCLIENQIQLECKNDKESSESFVLVNSDTTIEYDAAEGDGCKLKCKDDGFTTEDKKLNMSEEPRDFIEDGDSVPDDNLSMTDKALATAEKETDMGCEDAAAEDASGFSGDFDASIDNPSVTEEPLANAVKETDMATKDGSAEDASDFSEDFEASNVDVGGLSDYNPSVTDEPLANAVKDTDVASKDASAEDSSDFSEDFDASNVDVGDLTDYNPVTDEALATAEKETDTACKDSSAEEASDFSEDFEYNPSVTDEPLADAVKETDMGFKDGSADDASDFSEDFDAPNIDDGGLSGYNPSVTDEYAVRETDIGLKDGSADYTSDFSADDTSDFSEDDISDFSEDFDVADINDGGLEKDSESLGEESFVILPRAEEQGMDVVSALESMTLEDTNDNNNLTKETTTLELSASADLLPEIQDKERENSCDVAASEKPPTEELGTLGASDGPVFFNANAQDTIEAPVFTAEPSKTSLAEIGTELSNAVPPTCLTPLKKSASKTPVKTSASKKTPTTTKILSDLFDDKENIDMSATKLVLTKEKKKSKDLGQTQYATASLRKLKKELKEKMSQNIKKDEQVMSSRPALQAVPENIVGE